MFAELFVLLYVAHLTADYPFNAAKAVSTIRSVSVRSRSRRSSGLPSQGGRVAVVQPRGLASRFALVGGR
ncbi:hypothetical protein SUDANB96_06671 [Streptomyces sp. enrichment culture]